MHFVVRKSTRRTWSGLQPTEVFETYWRFAAERQRVYMARVRQLPGPWTDDPVIGQFRFTNPYRAADRVSQYLIRQVIYREGHDFTPEDTLFRILLFKLFNRIDTWRLLESELGSINWGEYRFDKYDAVLTGALDDRQRIYSAAYIMPPAGSYGHPRKHRNHLMLLEVMMRGSLSAALARTATMKAAFETLSAFPGIGSFLAYQFVTDINYSELVDYPEDEFVVAGPGAVDGIKKCFPDASGCEHADLIRLAADRQEETFERLGESFEGLFGRRLQYIDCQNLFCEVDKYARIAHPTRRGKSGRTRIKQKFSAAGPLPAPWFPPKWGINSKVDSVLGGATRWS